MEDEGTVRPTRCLRIDELLENTSGVLLFPEKVKVAMQVAEVVVGIHQDSQRPTM